MYHISQPWADRFSCASSKFCSCLCLSCQVPRILLHSSSKNCCFFLQVVGVWGVFSVFFSFSCGLGVCPQETQRIDNSRKWSLLSKRERIPGQILAQSVAGRCLRGIFVPDQPVALDHMMWAHLPRTSFQTGVFPSLGHFWVFCRVSLFQLPET